MLLSLPHLACILAIWLLPNFQSVLFQRSLITCKWANLKTLLRVCQPFPSTSRCELFLDILSSLGFYEAILSVLLLPL